MQLTLSRLIAACLALLLPLAAAAQGLFSPALVVNDEVITRYELEQRAQLMRVLRFPGDPASMARRDLINDILRKRVAREAGIEATPEDIETAIGEFAARANLTGEQFIQILGQNGVSYETLRDFTAASVVWREFIRARFLARARPTDDEIDRALGQTRGGGGVRVLLSEIIIPANPGNIQRVEALAAQLSQIDTIGEFAAAARRHSASESRGRGGRLNWLPISNLPPGVQNVVLGLAPGQVSQPLSLPNAVALFQLRDIEETDSPSPEYSAIEYASYLLPGGKSPETLAQAERIRQRVDTCDDLYGVALGQPEEVLERSTLPPAEIPQDVALELARLDAGEISASLTRANGQTLVVLMLCGRTAATNQEASREQVAGALVQSRLTAFSNGMTEQLLADAIIIEK